MADDTGKWIALAIFGVGVIAVIAFMSRREPGIMLVRDDKGNVTAMMPIYGNRFIDTRNRPVEGLSVIRSGQTLPEVDYGSGI